MKKAKLQGLLILDRIRIKTTDDDAMKKGTAESDAMKAAGLDPSNYEILRNGKK